MQRKFIPWVVYACIVLASFLTLIFLQQRYTTILQEGTEYQWPVTLERQVNWVPSDTLDVHFLGARTTWLGQDAPQVGQTIYVDLGVQPNGVIYIKNASLEKPKGDTYIIATVQAFQEGIVQFNVPFHRYRVPIDKVDPLFYGGQYKGILLATLKIRDGRGVITGIYVKGVPLPLATPETGTSEKERVEYFGRSTET